MKRGAVQKRIVSALAAAACITTLMSGCNNKATKDDSSSSSGSTTSATTSATSPLPAVEGRKICGSFIQSWYTKDWTQERWDTELKNMSEAGMKYIILQSVVDLGYDTDSKKGQNPDLYKLKSVDSLYPSSIELLKNANKGKDEVKYCLEACKKYGMQTIIGPVGDNRWWLYGWGMPEMPSGATDPATESYFAKFIQENADISNQIADEMYQKYSKDYKDQIFCWYYNNEIWNIDIACKGTDNGVYAKLISQSMNLSLRHYTEITPGMPMMLSPYINPSLSTADQCGKMWKDIIALTEFRNGDIFSPQDSFGGHTDLKLDDWWSNYKAAADTKPGLILWSNNENFRTNGAVAPVSDYINKQVNVTAKYAVANISFSWNHYYSPLAKNPGYNQAFLYYVKNNKLETEAPSTPTLTADGKKVTWDATDNMGICGVHVYRNTKTNLFKTLKIGDDVNSVLEKTITLDSAGKYYISVFDFSGNESEPSEITIS